MINVLGIRHHGVGSAKMVLKRLEELSPDIVLVEGPPEIDDLLPYVGNEQLRPPVALMLYDEKQSQRSSFYPFSEFSPEWVAAKYAMQKGIPVKAIDLPAGTSLITKFEKGEKPKLIKIEEEPSLLEKKPEQEEVVVLQAGDPLSYLARIAGFSDSESWWESQFEMNIADNPQDYFEAIMNAMQTLRESEIPSSLDAENIYREAFMRTIVRQVQTEMYTNIVIVCGAWHAPALTDLEKYDKEDVKLLKKLPKRKAKINGSWIPWTNDRLSMYSGYGAGLQSPGWYEHLWTNQEDPYVSWLTKVATLFREKGQDISSAHIIESYRLAISLCQLRGKSSIHLAELNEAVLTVMCMGDGILMELIKRELIVGVKIGEVPEDIPKVPLQLDFEKSCKSLRLRLSATPKDVTLDLRKDFDLQKSAFLHRLNILGIPWANSTIVRTKGTFKEGWKLAWSPEMMLDIVDKAYLGNTVELASMRFVEEHCRTEEKFAKLVSLLIKVMEAGLDHSVQQILSRIDDLSTISADIQDIMAALPSLINIKRYGDVRNSDFKVLDSIVNRLSTKVCIHLPLTCYGLDEESGNLVFQLISELNMAFKINEEVSILEEWHKALYKVLKSDGVQKVIQGCVTRLLLDAENITEEEAFTEIRLALSLVNEPKEVASWVEGFLRVSGMILIYDNRLWNLLYEWVSGLQEPQFMELLPFIRRAFAKFEYGERKRIGEKAKRGLMDETKVLVSAKELDHEAAKHILPTLQYLMGHG